MDDIKIIIKQQIYALFTSRNITYMDDLPRVWYEDLKIYDAKLIIDAFTKERREGGQYPSIANIIKYASKKPDRSAAAIKSWSNVMSAYDKSTSKYLTDKEKEVLKIVCPGELTELIAADDFKKGTIQRAYIKLYTEMLSGADIQKNELPESNLKKIGINTDNIF